ncbi:MAG: outer membrane protein assembly factor BamE [Hydrogenophaga sp.]
MPTSRSDAARRCPVRSLAMLLGVVVTVLAGCSSLGDAVPGVSGWVSPHQIDIQQGNVVTREQVQALREGLLRVQVRDLLGSPLLTSVFHGERWDYVFTFKRKGQPLQQRRLAVFFKGDVLERIETDAMPSEAEFVASLDVRRAADKTPRLEASEEQLRAFATRNAPGTPQEMPVPVRTAPVTYPPLESSGAGQ